MQQNLFFFCFNGIFLVAKKVPSSYILDVSFKIKQLMLDLFHEILKS